MKPEIEKYILALEETIQDLANAATSAAADVGALHGIGKASDAAIEALGELKSALIMADQSSCIPGHVP